MYRIIFALSIISVCIPVAFDLMSDTCHAGQPDIESDSTFSNTLLPELTEESTLDNYLAYGILKNPGLKADYFRWRASLEKIQQAGVLPDPRISYSYYVRDVETRVGPQNHKIGVSQKFPWFGKLKLKTESSASMAEFEQQRYEITKQELLYKIKKAYHDYYFLGESIKIAAENIQLLSYFEEIIRTKYTVGTAEHSAIIRTQVELGKLEDRLATLNDVADSVKARFNLVLNRDIDALLPFPNNIPDYQLEISNKMLLSMISDNSPELKAINSLLERNTIAVDLAKKNYYPDLTVGFSYIVTGESEMDVTDNGKDPLMLMFSINLPVWRSKYRAIENEARANSEAYKEKKQEKENNLYAHAQAILQGYLTAERRLVLYQHTLIPKAHESLEVVQLGYVTGKSEFLDLIDAQRTLLQFKEDYLRAIVDLANSYAELELLAGRELVESVEEEPDTAVKDRVIFPNTESKNVVFEDKTNML